MLPFVLVGAGSGVLFGIMDGVINANPLARRLMSVYKPIARTSINPIVGMGIDLLYGFAMAGIFLVLRASLPGQTGLLKGVSFGLMAWFFRVAMRTASDSMMFRIPPATTLYGLATGLAEMLVIGILYGLALR